MIYDFGSIFLKHPRNSLKSSPISCLGPSTSNFFSQMVLVGSPFTMYSYFSLLSLKIKFQQHGKLSNFQKSPKTPPKSSPKSGLGPSLSNLFSEMLLVGSHTLCIQFSAFTILDQSGILKSEQVKTLELYGSN